MEPINYHTLADFRSSHKDSLDQLFVEVFGIMSAEGLITLERVMHDGTKIKALADGSSFRREERIREHLKAAEEQVKQPPDEETSLRAQKARERAARGKKERMDKALQELEKIRATKSGEEKKEARASITDPDARNMKQSDGGYAPSYNLQLSTDAAAGVIIGVGVSQHPDDSQELMPAVERIEENLSKTPQPSSPTRDTRSTRRRNEATHHRDEWGQRTGGTEKEQMCPEDRGEGGHSHSGAEAAS